MKIIDGVNMNPQIEGLPKDNIVLFFGQITVLDGFGWVVVFGPEDSLKETEIGLVGTKCQVAFGPIDEFGSLEVIPVIHGHKHLHIHAGGMAETEKGIVFWRAKSNPKGCSFQGHKFTKIFISR